MPDLVRLSELLGDAFAAGDHALAATNAVLVIQNGETVAEQYGEGFDQTSTFISWSMAKSMTSAICGMLIADGKLSLDAQAPVPQWHSPGDPRAAITLRHLLQMRSGLEWIEDYVDDGVSDVIEMLRKSTPDMAAFAIDKPLEAEPGSLWKYSSGTTNILTRIVSDALGGGPADERESAMRAFLRQRLFDPLGMASAEPKFDSAGTWVGSSYVYATARDFARFGQLYLDDGVTPEGDRLLSSEWVADSVKSHAIDPESGQGYGLQWWTVPGPAGAQDMYSCNGYEGQRIQVSPDTGVVMVRLGKTPADHSEDLRDFYASVMSCFTTP